MDISYIAHSERCALLLDGEGVCRWVVPKVDASHEIVAAAKRCVGAQFLASLDPDAPGLMGHAPRVGTHLLFGLETNGRVALVRFGPLRALEELGAPAAPLAPSVPTSNLKEDDELATTAELLESGDLIDAPTGSFTSLDAATARIADAPFSKVSLDTLDQSLHRIAELTARASEVDDSQRHIITTTFTRAEQRALLEAELDVEIVTGSFARASTRDLEDAETAEGTQLHAWRELGLETCGEAAPETTRAGRRPSGFMLRRPTEPTTMRAVDPRPVQSDDVTRRFSCLAGELVEEEPDTLSERLEWAGSALARTGRR